MKPDSSQPGSTDYPFMTNENQNEGHNYPAQEETREAIALATQNKRAIVEDALQRIELPADLKEELIDFTATHFTVTPDNVMDSLKESLFEINESLRDLLEESGVMVNYDGTIDPENPINQPLLKQPEIAGPYEKYLELLGYKDYLDALEDDKNVVEKYIPSSVELIETTLDNYNLPPDIQDEIFEEIYSKNENIQSKINSNNVENFILKAADNLKISLLVSLYQQGFSLNIQDQLTLPENKKELLENETIAWNLKRLEAFYKITNPGKTSVEVVLTASEKQSSSEESKTETVTASPEYKIRLDLTKFGFSEKSIKTAENETIASLLGDSTIGPSGNTQRGLTGFEQIIDRAIVDLQTQAGFTLDNNREPILKESWLQKTLLAWNKRSRIAETKASPEYQQLVSLLDLQAETQQKIAEAKQNRPNRTRTGEFAVSPPTALRQNSEPTNRRGSLPVTALAGAAAGIMAGTALYKNQNTDAIEAFDTNTLISPNKTEHIEPKNSTTISPRFEEIDSVQTRRPLSEASVVTINPAIIARTNDSETARPAKEVLEEVKPTVAKKSTFKKPTSFGTKQAPKRFKIDPFTYQDTDPAEAPKIDRPVEAEDYEEAPDLDVPPAFHKRLVEKNSLPLKEEEVIARPALSLLTPEKTTQAEPTIAVRSFAKPTKLNKETVRSIIPSKSMARRKESPYLATPSVPGTIKGPEEKVKAELRLPKNNKVEETKQELKKTPDISTSKNNVQEDSKKSIDAEEQETIETERFYKAERVARELSSKFSQISDLGRLEDQIKSGTVVADLTLLPSYEQKLYTDITQLRPAFEAQKDQALQIGEEILTKVMTAEKSAANKTRMQRLNSQKQMIVEGIEIIKQVNRDLKKLDEQAERKLVGYPVLKPIKKKTGKDYPDKNNLAKAK